MNRVPTPARDALKLLQDGNARFVDADRCIDTYLGHTKLDEHLEGQAPYAIVLGIPVAVLLKRPSAH